jgi:essential nuclear protein 1
MVKVKKKGKSEKPAKQAPLATQIIQEEDNKNLRKTPRAKLGRASKEDMEDSEVMPAGLSQKLLGIARAQKLEEGGDGLGLDDLQDDIGTGGDRSEEDDEICDVEVDEEGFAVLQGATEEEERALSLFLPGAAKASQKQGPTLADVILQKIQEHEMKKEGEAPSAAQAPGLSPKVIEVYGEIGKWLKHYKSGKLPKAFKVIPSLVNWEEVLSLTSPLAWSPAAMYEAVNIFASSLNPRMAQRFFNLVLLPAVRQNIAEHKKLNFHYYRSLRKSIFKPAAFFKGIVLPLATESCTLREAMILSSVLQKASIPTMHAAATIVRLCSMTPWFGTTSIILAAMVNKMYALPVRVLDSLVAHFCAFSRDSQALPLVWHRALLIFVQRYKFELGEEHRRRLKELLRVHFHDAMGPEVRREMLAPKPGEAPPSETASAMDIG